MAETGQKKDRYIPAIAVVLIIAAGLIAYGNTLRNGFAYDDPLVVQGNSFLTSPGNILHLFDKDYFLGSGETSWRAMVTLTYFLDYSFWKFKPFGYHLTNLVFHISSGILLHFFLLLLIPLIAQELQKKIKKIKHWPKHISLPLISAIIFVTHPIQSETVNSIGFRHDVVMTFFCLFSLLLYVRAKSLKGRRKAAAYAVSMVSYFLAMASKEMAVVLPAMALLIEIFIFIKHKSLRLISRENIIVYSGYLAVLIFYCLVRFAWLVLPAERIQTIFYGKPFLDGNVYHWFLTMSRILAGYITLFIFPVNLTPEHLVPLSTTIWNLKVLTSLLLLMAVLAIIIRTFKKAPLIAFSFLWIFMPLVTVSNITPLHHPMAERYLYLSTAGFATLLGTALTRLFIFFEGRKRLHLASEALEIFFIILFGLYSVRAITQNEIWHDEKTFWESVVKKPGMHRPRAYAKLGTIALHENRPDDAIALFKQAIEIDPTYIDAYNNLGIAHYQKGDYDRSIEYYKKTLDFDDGLSELRFVRTCSNIGIVYMAKEDPVKAAEYFKEALRRNPYMAETYSNLGWAYSVSGVYDKAIDNYKEALRLNPYLARVYANIGNVYVKKSEPDMAIENYKKALDIEPDLVMPNYALGELFLDRKLYQEAAEYFKRVVQLAPGFADAYNGLYACYYNMGDAATALECLKKYESIKSENMHGGEERPQRGEEIVYE